MKRVLIVLALFVSFLFADSTLLVKKGWQLIGLNSDVKNLSLFETKNVEQIWHYDAKSQKWQGYSPDVAIQNKMTDQNFSTITELKSWHGFWVKSRQDWQLISRSENGKIPVKGDTNITLEKGWNLISLPIDSVVSPYIFDDITMWKYNNKNWEFFDSNRSDENFPLIGHISNSDGIWVKSATKQTISVPENSARLRSFENEAKMKAYIKDMLLINDRPYFGYHTISFVQEVMQDDGVVIDSNIVSFPAKVDDVTGTNLQESDVDESDILKHNGVNIFFVDNQVDSKISVTTFSRILKAQEKPLKFIELNSSKKINALYLIDDKLVVLSTLNSSSYKDNTPSKRSSMPTPSYDLNKIVVDTYNVSDIENIEKIGSIEIDGRATDSRVVDGKLILISSFYPYIEKNYPKIYVDAPECKNFSNGGSVTTINSESNDYDRYSKCYELYRDNKGRFFKYDYDNPTVVSENLIPMIKRDENTEIPLLNPATFYVPIKKDQKANITTVSKIDIKDMKLLDSSSILGDYSVVYASSKALYLVSVEYPIYYDFNSYKERSSIYKFKIDDGLVYKGMGFVNGKALNQFSLSEYKDVLRIATTQGFSWQGDTDNSIYTLREIDGVLTQIGFLGSLGLEGERIYSVRFMADRGYVVTFRETDPFYTLDLSDYSNPKKVGELKIEGFSNYLHPVGDSMIMGVGRDENRKLKLELFDVSNFANPDSIDKYIFDESGNYSSEVLYNHKALAYRVSDDLFAFPFSGGNYNIGYRKYLGVFQIVDRKFKTYNTMIDSSNKSYSGLNRGIIFDVDGVIYVAYLVNGVAKFATLKSLEKE